MPLLKQSLLPVKKPLPMEHTKFDEKIWHSLLLRENWVERGNSACRARSFLLTLMRLRSLTRWLNDEHSIALPACPLTDVSSIKQFTDGLISGDPQHVWRRWLLSRHLPLRVRCSVASTLFLFRKVLPCAKLSKKEALRVAKKYIEKMTTPQSPASDDFLRYCYNTVRGIFRRGWDRSWHSRIDNFTLPVKSCLENRAGGGGVRSLAHEDFVYFEGEFISRLERDYRMFVRPDESALGGVPFGRKTKIMTIYTGGKNRTVSMFEARRSFLSPLHNMIYDRLSRESWLLRGDAKKDVFLDFVQRDGEVVVSGDYESATDNLNLSVSQTILRAIRDSSHHVPITVWDGAEAALVSEFEDGSVQTRGQLMGSLLSFPLLCLANFLAFKWAIPRSVPLKINGDDIVFRATPSECERWFSSVGESGLTLSKGKTLVSKTLFSLNSTFFLSRKRKIETVPILRSSSVWNPVDSPAALEGRILNATNFKKTEKIFISILRTCSKWIWMSQRSVTRGLRASLSHAVLRGAGLSAREAFYSRVEREPHCPPPFKRWQHWGLPAGWETFRTEDGKGDDVGAVHALVKSTWDGYTLHDDISISAYIRLVKQGTYTYVPLNAKYFRMLGACPLSFSDIKNDIKKIKKEKTVGERVWRKVAR